MKRLVSGIQATGALHLGNYLGAIKNWVDLLNKGYEGFLFVADLHSLTVPQDPKALQINSINAAATYIACGIDPNKHVVFLQSAIHEHPELTWILSCFTPIGWLNRMTQFKDKKSKYKESSTLGLYAYPILQAADILLYQPDFVPVGEDQKQHLELTRDIAQTFNNTTGSNFFKIPEPIIVTQSARIKSLKDGNKKMSKSDESDYSRINLYDEPDIIRLKFKKAKSDSIPTLYYDTINRPEISNLINIYSSLSGRSIKEIENQYKGQNFSNFKNDLADLTISVLTPISSEFKRITQNKTYIYSILQNGKEKAQKIASTNLSSIKNIIGLCN